MSLNVVHDLGPDEVAEEEAHRAETPIFQAVAEAYDAPWFGLFLDFAEEAEREDVERFAAGPF